MAFSFVDRTGKVTPDYWMVLTNLDTEEVLTPYDADGTVNLRLPRGRYAAIGQIQTPDDGETLLVEPEFQLNGTTAIPMDGRMAQPLTVAVPDSDATPIDVQVNAVFTGADPQVGIAGGIVSDTGRRGPYFGQRRPSGLTKGLVSRVTAHLARADSSGSIVDSPYAYHLSWTDHDRLPTGLRARLTQRDVATVHARYASQGVTTATTSFFAEPPIDSWLIFNADFPLRLPSDRIEYYSADARWSSSLTEGTFASPSMILQSPWTSYPAGKVRTERRNGAVFGPGFPVEVLPWPWVERIGDDLVIAPPLYVDSAGAYGSARTATGQLLLSRNGVVIADVPSTITVQSLPPDTADYRLEVRSTRGAPSTISTQVAAAWTFRSGTGDAILPLSAVRLRPDLDNYNIAPANQPFTVPFTVEWQASSSFEPLVSLTVDVSYDDGATWHQATVNRDGSTGSVLVNHPASAGFVSLRTTSTDAAGNTAEQTIIRAYRIA